MKSLFLYDRNDLESKVPGGVQLCTKEFLDIVRAASDHVELLSVKVTRDPLWRLRRKLHLGSYLLYDEREIRQSLSEKIAASRPTHVFLNKSELMRLAPMVKKLCPEAQVIIMSHGNQSGDDLYEIAGSGGRRASGIKKLVAIWQIGLDLVSESYFRHHHVDGVIVMSEEEQILERWLGAKKTFFLPRVIYPEFLDWRPASGRVGYVGTLNHTPNRVALESILNELSRHDISGLDFRIAGGPESLGNELAHRFPFVTYIGRPDDRALKKEVSTWSLFLNPVFWLSRGASMKLGQALSWGIPTLTTRSGARGYRLHEGQTFQTEDDVGIFCREMINLTKNPDQIVKLHNNLTSSDILWPSVNSISVEMKNYI